MRNRSLLLILAIMAFLTGCSSEGAAPDTPSETIVADYLSIVARGHVL